MNHTESVLDDADLAYLSARRFGHLATVSPAGHPMTIPVCFAALQNERGVAIVSALDDKPKRVEAKQLGRIRNILSHPEVSFLVDETSEDWSRLSYLHIAGRAVLLEPGSDDHAAAISVLRQRYPQYREMAIDERPVISITPERRNRWAASAGDVAPRPRDLGAVITGRRSVRSLRPEPVPRGVIERAIAAAGWAPSPHGRQPWRFVVIESTHWKKVLADAMSSDWQSQLALDGQDQSVIAIRLGKSRERVLNAPALILACLYLEDLDRYPDADRQSAETVMAIQSLGAAIQNFLLTIYADGYDTGWMCAPLFCPETVRASLGLANGLIPHALLPVGLAAADPVRRPRMPADQLIADWL